MGPHSFDRERRDGERFGPPARRMDGQSQDMRRQPPRDRDDSHRDRANRDQDRNRLGPPRGAERDGRDDDDLTF